MAAANNNSNPKPEDEQVPLPDAANEAGQLGATGEASGATPPPGDVPAPQAPAPAPTLTSSPIAQQAPIVVQVAPPSLGEPTPGLKESARRGGDYRLVAPNGTVTRVDAEGQPIK